MVTWFQATEKYYNKRNSFIQMVKIVSNCDTATANLVYDKYSGSSYWQRVAIGRDVRKRHHEIVYGDKKGEFHTGINKTAPYPNFPVTKFLKDKMPYLKIYLPDLVAEIREEQENNLEREPNYSDLGEEEIIYIENMDDYNKYKEE